MYNDFIIPSIDLLDENIVRLHKGDYDQKTIYNLKIDDLLFEYKDFKNLHIVDLNGAKSDGQKNIELIKKIRSKFNGIIQIGGGIRSLDVVDKILNEIKIDRAVLGTIAIKNIDSTKEILQKFTKEKIVLALDCELIEKDFICKSNGWKDNSNVKLNDLLFEYKDFAKYILVTDINVDGTMQGPNIELYKKIKQSFPNYTLQASGGVSSIEDVHKLMKISDFSIIGKALYDENFKLEINKTKIQ